MREKSKILKDRFKDKISNLFHKLNSIQKDYYTKILPKACKDVFTLGSSKSYPMTLNFNKGFCVGLYKGLNSLKPTYYDAPLSTLIIAPPGSGKTAAVAVPNLLNVPSSCVVLDIKGELCNLTAGYRQKHFKNKIFIFNPYGTDNSLYFNPFDKNIVSKMSFSEKRRLVEEIANTIFNEKSQDPHWVEQAKNVFTFHALYELCVNEETTLFEIALSLDKNYTPLINKRGRFYPQVFQCVEKSKEEGGGFEMNNDGTYMLDKDANGKPIQIADVDVRKLWYQQVAEQIYIDIDKKENYDGTINKLELKLDKDKMPILEEGMLDPFMRSYANRWANANDKEFSSIKSTFDRFMQVFTDYRVKRATSKMSFEYEDLRKDNITLYIKIAQTDIDIIAPLIRVLLESIGKNLLLKESKRFDERIYFILDEFVRFGKLSFLLEMPALSRSYGVVLLYITQSNAMIEKYYGKEDAKILNGTVNYRVLFRMNDYEYAQQISNEIGKMTRKTRSHSTEKGQLIMGGTSSIGKEAWDLLSAQDIMNIDKDEVIILVSGHKAKPLKLKANHYFKNKELLSRINWEVKPNEEVFDALKKDV
ncbi:type IV secretory system conjugative DNA transfer family protein [Helicobacter pylori]|nr:type IV secretory system conjugative DNA transfer family protein [Helicobacter pylori]